MVTEHEQEIINDIFRIAKAVKNHLQEPNCTHGIRFIVKQALEDNSAVVTGDSSTGLVPEPATSEVSQKS